MAHLDNEKVIVNANTPRHSILYVQIKFGEKTLLFAVAKLQMDLSRSTARARTRTQARRQRLGRETTMRAIKRN
jgi:hypothetical protein